MPVKINWPMVAATVTPNLGGLIGAYCVNRNYLWYEVRIVEEKRSEKLNARGTIAS